MKNPWLKKNPFMSMWLSGANAITGKARSAEATRKVALAHDPIDFVEKPFLPILLQRALEKAEALRSSKMLKSMGCVCRDETRLATYFRRRGGRDARP